MPLSEADKQTCIEAFRLHETQPGFIAAGSLGEVLRCPGANPSEAELRKFSSGKTQIKLEEFLAIIEQLPLHKDPRAELQDAFSIFDIDGTGFVDASEFRTVMGNLGERLDATEVEEIMRVPEQDLNGKINYKDIIEFICANN
eukprot:m.225537 g.225537  ORF g.225537 m.225537 type:complete len:143 (-) comp16720_c0_seq1:34-462(-)